jgi:hypothetical protein
MGGVDGSRGFGGVDRGRGELKTDRTINKCINYIIAMLFFYLCTKFSTFLIRDILVWIRILGSIPLTN